MCQVDIGMQQKQYSLSLADTSGRTTDRERYCSYRDYSSNNSTSLLLTIYHADMGLPELWYYRKIPVHESNSIISMRSI